MGNHSYNVRQALLRSERRWRAEQEDAEKARRMALADKIVLAIVDRISADIIRPGPTPEERECYIMAQELRDHSTPLKELVAAILAVEDEDPDHAR